MKPMLRLKAMCLVLAFVMIFVSLPMVVLSADNNYKNGLWGEYYNGEKFDTYVTARTDSSINFSWSGTAPAPGVNTEHFSIRWIGQIFAESTDTYTFYTSTDDGVKLKINGKYLIIDKGPHGPEERKGTIDLEGGKYYELEIEYYNSYGGGEIKLYWQSPTFGKQIVPAQSLFAPKYKVDVTLESGSDYQTARAKMFCNENIDAKLVMKKYDLYGNLVDNFESNRNGQYLWEVTDTLGDEKNFYYSAYVVDNATNEVISEEITKQFGVDYTVDIDIDNVLGEVSPYLYGACIEDVNHELYGGIWAQMIFGENFAEPGTFDVDGVSIYGGDWTTSASGNDTQINVRRVDNGPKLVFDNLTCTTGEVSLDVKVSGDGPAGLIVKVSDAGMGADSFNGYEIGVMNNVLRLAKHQQNYTNIRDVQCNAPLNTWVNLKVQMTSDNLKIYINNQLITEYTDPAPLTSGAIGLRAWNCDASFKNIKFGKDVSTPTLIEMPNFSSKAVSGMWRSVKRGNAVGEYNFNTTDPFIGSKSQVICFTSGTGAIGINNMGLNRKGMNFEKDKDYNGYFYAKSQQETPVFLVFESANGQTQYCETEVLVSGNEWTKYSFELTPNAKDAAGRFTIELRAPGSVEIGYVYLQPGEWGLYKGLPFRRDVCEALENQELTVLRFGGSMINNNGYMWKRMLGAPEFRENYSGHWYPYSSFGFGIFEFLQLCDSLGILGIPALNSYESPQDVADFIDFATGTDRSNPWVQKRIEMGHPEPFDLPYLQIGNEERIDQNFAARFNNIASYVWAKDENIILVAGDFDYKEIIRDPYNFSGAASGITTLAGHKLILDHATQNGREVWLDIHFWTNNQFEAMNFFDAGVSLYNALKTICPDAKFKLAVFELNSHHHIFERALANAYCINRSERLSDMFAVMCSANCLQVDGHNDNGWDQGLVFMNNDSVWYQPPAYITKMSSSVYQPYTVDAVLSEQVLGLDVTATKSENGKTVVAKIVNVQDNSCKIKLNIPGLASEYVDARIISYADELSARNTSKNPQNSKPKDEIVIRNALNNGSMTYELPANSYTTIVLTVSELTRKPGDINGDDKVTVVDIVALRGIIMNETELDPDTFRIADLNEDGYISVTDIIALRRIIMSQTD